MRNKEIGIKRKKKKETNKRAKKERKPAAPST